MGLKKGMTNNPNGRPRGKPNKSTDELREIVQKFLEDNLETMQKDYDSLKPVERLAFIEKLFKHVLPAPLQELERLTDEQLDELITRLKNAS